MEKKPLILIVDDAPTNILILMEFLKDTYSVIAAKSGSQALLLADRDFPPDLILLDIMMPKMDGYETLTKLKENQRTAHIPVIFVTSLNEDSDQSRGLALGAVDFISKPFNPDIVKLRIQNQLVLKRHRDNLEEMVRERTRELEETRLEIIRYLGRAAEYRDNETGYHIIRMSQYAQLLAQKCGDIEAELVLNAAPMHDIGKIGIPDKVLLKPGPLDPEEWNVMKNHCSIGHNILDSRSSELMRYAATAALSHHERWDGTGYPRALKEADIPLIGRIVTVADVFDALISHRPYKEPWKIETAYKYVVEKAGTQFDPRIIECFVSVFPEIVKIAEEYRD